MLVTEFIPASTTFFEAVASSATSASEPVAPKAMAALGSAMARLISEPLADDPAVRRREADRLRDALPGIEQWAAGIGVTRPLDGAAPLLEDHANPRLAALTQGDPAPSNMLFVDDRCMLVDFEYAAQRHPLFDLAQWHIRCPLPDAWLRSIEEPIREVYTGDFERGLARAKSYAGLYMLSWLPKDEALERNPPWADSWSVREALISTALRCANAAPELASWFTDLSERLCERWPECGDGAVDWTQ